MPLDTQSHMRYISDTLGRGKATRGQDPSVSHKHTHRTKSEDFSHTQHTGTTDMLMNYVGRLEDALGLLDDIDASEYEAVNGLLREDAQRYYEDARDALNKARLDALLAMVDQCDAGDAGSMVAECTSGDR